MLWCCHRPLLLIGLRTLTCLLLLVLLLLAWLQRMPIRLLLLAPLLLPLAPLLLLLCWFMSISKEGTSVVIVLGAMR